MELRHLRYFTAVAEELNFRRAAEQLHIAQPPLSKQIGDLEEELGVELFRRTRRRVELTEAGRVFLAEARLTLEQAEQAARAAQRASRGEIGRLVIGFVMSATCTVLPESLRVFRARYPHVELAIEETTTGQGVEDLHKKRIHLAFLRLPLSDKALRFETVLQEPLILALPEGHPLANKPQVSVRMLAGQPFIIFPRDQGSGFFDQIVSFCNRAGFSPKVVQEATQMQTILSLVASGLGVALIPASVQSLHSSGVVYKALRERTPKTGIAVAWLPEDTSPALAEFLGVVRAMAATSHRPSKSP
ncbi:MAG: LysR family transcriptional regulator [Acidobacteria bacterium]|nr:LysR family transcriptional regulator [Acidobacteriota bacterium]